ncbi:MAG: SDR family NAD(P)-dependent oxidoreductase, partial [Actinomycetota bacterium]|nr:SDR family NAD(P)-dependent oxidoreductase [Actinomycetota bacterium]
MQGQIDIPGSFPAAGDVRGKRVVLTGAGRGLGEVLAHAFSTAGAKVALVARTQADLDAVAAALPGDTLTFAGDVRDPAFNEQVATGVADAWGGL